MKRRLGLLTLIMLTALLAAACGGGPAATPTTTPPAEPGVQPTSASGEVKIVITGFAFDPATVTVPVGTKVTWTNEDGRTHTVTSDGGDWDSGKLKDGQLFSHTFTEAGTFGYHCAIHTSMKGTITVTP